MGLVGVTRSFICNYNILTYARQGHPSKGGVLAQYEPPVGLHETFYVITTPGQININYLCNATKNRRHSILDWCLARAAATTK